MNSNLNSDQDTLSDQGSNPLEPTLSSASSEKASISRIQSGHALNIRVGSSIIDTIETLNNTFKQIRKSMLGLIQSLMNRVERMANILIGLPRRSRSKDSHQNTPKSPEIELKDPTSGQSAFPDGTSSSLDATTINASKPNVSGLSSGESSTSIPRKVSEHSSRTKKYSFIDQSVLIAKIDEVKNSIESLADIMKILIENWLSRIDTMIPLAIAFQASKTTVSNKNVAEESEAELEDLEAAQDVPKRRKSRKEVELRRDEKYGRMGKPKENLVPQSKKICKQKELNEEALSKKGRRSGGKGKGVQKDKIQK